MSNAITAPITIIQNVIVAPVTLGIVGGGGAGTWDELADKPSTFPPTTHTHAPSEVTGTALVSADATESPTASKIVKRDSDGTLYAKGLKLHNSTGLTTGILPAEGLHGESVTLPASGVGMNLALTSQTDGTISLASTDVVGILPGANGGTGVANTGKTLTLGANSAINQDVSTTASPTFASMTLTNGITSLGDDLAKSSSLGAMRATKAIPRRVVLLGDSITDMCGGPRLNGSMEHYHAAGYYSWASIYSGARFNFVKNAGISGDNLASMSSRFASDVAAHTPEIVVVLGGINDIIGISGDRESVIATIKTKLTEIYDKAAAIGAICVAGTMTPCSTPYVLTSDQSKAWQETNQWIRIQCRTRSGMVLADFAAALTDPATANTTVNGNANPVMLNDGLHPTAAGANVMGRVLAASMAPITPEGSLLSCGAGAANKITHPALMGASGTTQPTGWNLGSQTGTSDYDFDYEPRTDGIAGSWLTVDVGITGSEHFGLDNYIYSGFSTGEKYKLLVEYEIATENLATPNVNHMMGCFIATKNNVGDLIEMKCALMIENFGAGGYGGQSYNSRSPVGLRAGVMESPAVTITSDTNFVNAHIRLLGRFKIRIGRVSVIKVN